MTDAYAFADSSVWRVDSANATCQQWPALSSFTAADLIVGAGDSGGPAWSGAELAGLVHGERCKNFWEPTRHAFVHVPSLRDFVAPFL